MKPIEKSRIINYAKGAQSQKQAHITRLKAEYERNFTKSLEYEADAKRNGAPQEFIARKTKGSQRYELASRPNETFNAGDLIDCYGSTWIVTEVNANKDIYTSGYMVRCNTVFKFQLGDKIVERWGVLDPGVYSTTIKDTLVMPELNKQFKIFLPYDDETKHLTIDRRFAVGSMYDVNGKEVLSVYRITGYDPQSENYGDDRLLVLYCKSDVYDPHRDNIELGICDYHAPADTDPVHAKCVISYVGQNALRVGGAEKTLVCTFYDDNDNVLTPDDVVWDVVTLDANGLNIVKEDNMSITISLDSSAMIGTLYNVIASSESLNAEGSLIVKAVSMI